jgi:hypothetical protein
LATATQDRLYHAAVKPHLQPLEAVMVQLGRHRRCFLFTARSF